LASRRKVGGPSSWRGRRGGATEKIHHLSTPKGGGGEKPDDFIPKRSPRFFRQKGTSEATKKTSKLRIESQGMKGEKKKKTQSLKRDKKISDSPAEPTSTSRKGVRSPGRKRKKNPSRVFFSREKNLVFLYGSNCEIDSRGKGKEEITKSERGGKKSGNRSHLQKSQKEKGGDYPMRPQRRNLSHVRTATGKGKEQADAKTIKERGRATYLEAGQQKQRRRKRKAPLSLLLKGKRDGRDRMPIFGKRGEGQIEGRSTLCSNDLGKKELLNFEGGGETVEFKGGKGEKEDWPATLKGFLRRETCCWVKEENMLIHLTERGEKGGETASFSCRRASSASRKSWR